MTRAPVPFQIGDPINARILAVSEDKIQGFQREPLQEIARQAGLETPQVIERIQAMLRAKTIRRVRQTLMATNLAPGALVAWQVPAERIDSAFDYMFQQDPFSGHVVLRSADPATPGATYKLWTTLKVPQGYSMRKHCEFLLRQTGAEHFRLMPAKRLFALGVGHVRRRGMPVGSKAEVPAEAMGVEVVRLNELEWRVLMALKREFEPEELCENPWEPRSRQAGVTPETFCEVAENLNRRKVIGRFSTFLEHVKPLADGERVTRFNALFHWAVPPGREIEAGCEVGRHHILTHAYWREGGPEFRSVNIMAVAHGMERDLVLQHKEAIDRHLKQIGIPVSYTNVFWGGRSEIKPSEISPFAYCDWCAKVGLAPESMRAEQEGR
jgi:DNA-binding Lrp family transcriptional regulator